MPSDQTQDPEVKTYFLTKEEKADLLNRAAIKEQLIYQAHCVDMEMKMYVERYVKPRCGLKPEDTPTMYLQDGKFTVEKRKSNSVPTPPAAAVVPPVKTNEPSVNTSPEAAGQGQGSVPGTPGPDQAKQ